MKISWEDLTPQRLLDLLKAGQSYSMLGKLFGVSRNTVSGQIFRWRQAGKLPPVVPNARKPKSSKKAPEKQRKYKKSAPYQWTVKTLRASAAADVFDFDEDVPLATQPTGKTIQSAPPPTFVPYVAPERPKDVPPPTNEPIGIMELRPGLCATVVQQRPLLYCGCKANHRWRFCEYHKRIMVEPAPARRKKKLERLAKFVV
jgi:hypothetical protein